MICNMKQTIALQYDKKPIFWRFWHLLGESEKAFHSNQIG